MIETFNNLPSFLNVLISSGWFSNVLASFQHVLMSFVGLNYFGGFLEYFGCFGFVLMMFWRDFGMFWLGFRMFCILLSCFYCVGRFWNVWIHFGGF